MKGIWFFRFAMLLFAGIVLSPVISVSAAPIAVPNHSFELPAPGGAIPNWTYGISGPGWGTISLGGAEGGHGTNALDMTVNMASGTWPTSANAQNASSIATIAPYTTYTATVRARCSGVAFGWIDLLGNGGGIVGTNLGSSFTNKDYMLSFSTGGPGDSLVGKDLTVNFSLTCFAFGGGFAKFDNVRVDATVMPLTFQRLGANQLRLSWPTKWSGVMLESNENLANGAWSTVTNVPAVQGTEYVVLVDADGARKYFRLSTP